MNKSEMPIPEYCTCCGASLEDFDRYILLKLQQRHPHTGQWRDIKTVVLCPENNGYHDYSSWMDGSTDKPGYRCGYTIFSTHDGSVIECKPLPMKPEQKKHKPKENTE